MKINESRRVVHLSGASFRESWAVMAAVLRMDENNLPKRVDEPRTVEPAREVSRNTSALPVRRPARIDPTSSPR